MTTTLETGPKQRPKHPPGLDAKDRSVYLPYGEVKLNMTRRLPLSTS
jgi:hypothetical protein